MSKLAEWSPIEADRLWDDAMAVAQEFAPGDVPYIRGEIIDHLNAAYDNEDLDAMRAACRVLKSSAREYVSFVEGAR